MIRVFWIFVAGGVGAAAGLRSMRAPATLGNELRHSRDAGESRLERTFASPRTARLLGALSLGEQVVEKLPIGPSPLGPAAMVMKMASGALSAAVLAARHSSRVLPVAALGGTAAVLTAYGWAKARDRLASRLHVPDAALRMVEDAIVVSAASRLGRKAFGEKSG